MLVLGLLVAIAVDLWAVAVVVRRSTGKRLPYAYLTVLATAAVAAYLTTFQCQYFLNENTRVHGWPVPVVIFQRENAEAPWLDFVGPTTVLGYPLNLAVFMLAPSVVILGLVYQQVLRGRSKQHDEAAAAETPSRPAPPP
jgi:hypothetical protein